MDIVNVDRSNASTFPKSWSTAAVPFFHRFRVYEIQINLWITVSSVYLQLKDIEKANAAMDEAEKILTNLCSAHDKCRHQVSRLFRESMADGMRASYSSLLKYAKDMKKLSGPLYSGGYWKDSDPAVARVQADVALQVFIS